MRLLLLWLVSTAVFCLHAADIVAVTDGTNYNAGSEVRIRIIGSNGGGANSGQFRAAIRFAGESRAAVRDIAVAASKDYGKLWKIPADARAGRYEVDLNGERNVTSFAVHRKSAQIARVEMGRTFYTDGDPIDCRVVIRNLLDIPLEGLRVEFGPFYYPWIAPAPDDPKIHPAVLAESLTIPAHGEQEIKGERVTVARGNGAEVHSYSIVIWDKKREHVYDLAFTEPVFSRPANAQVPKRYPSLYLYPSLPDVSEKAMAYRHFYPAEFVSSAIEFDAEHTIFPSGASPEISFQVHLPEGNSSSGMKVRGRVINAEGKQLYSEDAKPLPSGGKVRVAVKALPDGLYTYESSLVAENGTAMATNKLEFALDRLPKSILIFCAHEDDDTAHPALIRAAVENNIPIHVVYFTGGDAGGCDRYYMAACDASRAMDYGETRMEEAKASLAHLGVPSENVFFLGLPDGGMEEIWLNHHQAGQPYLSALLASDHAPYKNLVTPNLPYSRDPVVAVAKEFLRKYQPELVVTGHPEERHVDHRTNNWMVVKAMQGLLREGAIPAGTRMLVDVAYGATSWIHSPYQFEKQTFYVPGEVARRGQEALWFYQSQDGNHQQAELVKYEKLPRGEAYPHLWLNGWQKHEGWNEHNLAGSSPATR